MGQHGIICGLLRGEEGVGNLMGGGMEIDDFILCLFLFLFFYFFIILNIICQDVLGSGDVCRVSRYMNRRPVVSWQVSADYGV